MDNELTVGAGTDATPDLVGGAHPSSTSPCVWVVILNYNGGDKLIDCVASFRRLRREGLEVLVVDNRSSDGSAERVADAFPEIQLLALRENLGYTGGNNEGIRHALNAGADYVLLVNPDTIVVNPSFIDEMVAFAEENPRAGIVGPKVYYQQHGRVQNTINEFPPFLIRLLKWPISKIWLRVRSGDRVAKAPVLNGVCILMRRAMIDQVGLYDPMVFMYGDDWDYTMRCRRLGWLSYYIPVESIVHLQKEEGYDYASMVNFLLKRNAAYIMRKHGRHFDFYGLVIAGTILSFLKAARQSLLGRPDAPRYWLFLRRLVAAYRCIAKNRLEAPDFGPPNRSWAEMMQMDAGR